MGCEACGQLTRDSCERGVAYKATRLLRDLDHFPPEHRRRVVLGDCNPCQGDDPAVFGLVAIKRVVSPQEAGAVIKPLAVKGLEGARGDQREGEEHEVQNIWQSSNEPSLEVGGLALGEDLSGHATSQNK
eukprot:scaffold45883_cov70-Phaeocystis_antarctica.AAC.3